MKTLEPSTYISYLNIVTYKNGNWSELPLLQYENISDWGPKRDPLFIVIPFTILFATIFLSGLIGNISTCIVIAHNKSMHTATNYYLFSLAISDLLLLISGLPQEMYNIWSKYPYIFGEAFCVLQGFAAETSANATVLTITSFTVERYIAICHPFLSHTMSKLSRAVKLILLIWMVAICLAIPQAISFGIVYEELPDSITVNEEHNTCNVKRVVIPHAFLISTLLFFVTPMSLITILYILIGLQLRQSTVGPVRGGSIKLKDLVQKRRLIAQQNNFSANENGSSDLQLSQSEDSRTKCATSTCQASTQHVVKMLVAVVVAFFICWAPFHAQRLLAIYGQPSSSGMIATFTALTYISGVLYYLSTTINPLLYHIMSHKFRIAFKETFTGYLSRKKDPPLVLRYSAISARRSIDHGYPVNEVILNNDKERLYKHFRHKRKLHKNRKGVVYLHSEIVKDSDRVKYTPCTNNSKTFLRKNDLDHKINNKLDKSLVFENFNAAKLSEDNNWISSETSSKSFQSINSQIMHKRYNSCKFINFEQGVRHVLPKSLTMPNVNSSSAEPSFSF